MLLAEFTVCACACAVRESCVDSTELSECNKYAVEIDLFRHLQATRY